MFFVDHNTVSHGIVKYSIFGCGGGGLRKVRHLGRAPGENVVLSCTTVRSGLVQVISIPLGGEGQAASIAARPVMFRSSGTVAAPLATAAAAASNGPLSMSGSIRIEDPKVGGTAAATPTSTAP